MGKLVAAFVAADGAARAAAAVRLVGYVRVHPMAECMADAGELAALRAARAIVGA